MQCPYSLKAHRVLTELREDYGRKQVRIVFKHFPLPFHEKAKPAAVAASVVHRLAGPEAFWQFVDRAFENDGQLNEASYEKWAREAGVDVIAFRRGLDDPASGTKVEADMELVRQLGVAGTPTAYVNGQIVHGATEGGLPASHRRPHRARPRVGEQRRATGAAVC